LKTMDQEKLYDAIVEKLKTVIDPETGTDVIRMRLVQDISIDEAGIVTYKFRPSSPLCPIAVPLSLAIIKAISEVPEVSVQKITVVDYVQADLLNDILKTVV
jgi:metal-sulfur cluster biosynthetic enzyme